MKEYLLKKLVFFFSHIKKQANEKSIFYIIRSAIKLILFRIKNNIIDKGISYTVQSAIKLITNLDKFSLWINSDKNYEFWTWFYKNFKSSRKFKFQGNTYNYFYHSYSITWNNERSVEIPIVWKMYKKFKSKNVLEVGNVFSHFFNVNHDIVDKYEKSLHVINQDVVDYNPSKKYDLIITISTLEHVGWDETPREPMKIIRAIENLKSLLTPNGKIIITLPIGHSPVLDKLLDESKLHFSKQFCLKRTSKNNRWQEVCWDKIRKVLYGFPIRYSANGIVIGTIEKKNNVAD